MCGYVYRSPARDAKEISSGTTIALLSRALPARTFYRVEEEEYPRLESSKSTSKERESETLFAGMVAKGAKGSLGINTGRRERESSFLRV